VLRAAGLEVAAQETQHAGHASQLAADLDLGRTAALVMVGGDGTVFEALQARARSCPASLGHACPVQYPKHGNISASKSRGCADRLLRSWLQTLH